MRRQLDLFMILRKMIRTTTERRLLGNQEKLFLRLRNSKSASDGTNNTLESTKRKQLNTGLNSSKRKQQLIKLKLMLRPPKSPPKPKLLKKPKLLPKQKLPKPKKLRKPKLNQLNNNSRMSSSTSSRKSFQNLRHSNKFQFQ